MNCKPGRHENQWTVRHRMTGSPTYGSWAAMRARCSNPRDKDYPRYGGIGIAVCREWQESFDAFLADMGERPIGKTIDRIDRSLGYFKANCRWATPLEQTRNRSCSVVVSHAGVSLPLLDWCTKAGADYSTVHSRIFKHGWPLSSALFAPKHMRLKTWLLVASVPAWFQPEV